MCETTTIVECLIGPTGGTIDERTPGRIHIDACIADEVRALNEAGVRTIGSCCAQGHDGPFPEPWIVVYKGDAGKLAALGYDDIRPPRYHPYLGGVEVWPKSLPRST